MIDTDSKKKKGKPKQLEDIMSEFSDTEKEDSKLESSPVKNFDTLE